VCAVGHFIVSGRLNFQTGGQERVASTVGGLAYGTEHSNGLLCHPVYIVGLSCHLYSVLQRPKTKMTYSIGGFFVSCLLKVYCFGVYERVLISP
jgi:hypothetical protein